MRTDGQTDRQIDRQIEMLTDMTKLTRAFRYYANASETAQPVIILYRIAILHPNSAV